ncbi:MAG: 2-oxo acid dehydrogenase subunit E2 [Alphaproteobacteria bacterium]|nr:2-oxo acid dehydrogenase subunit E2 [Alphaproteobacteria bacterium]
MSEFKMPALGADMDHGTLVEWLKQPGDHLTRGDIIAVVETDKGAVEVEVFEDGTLERLIAKPGERLPVGAPIAIIRDVGERAPSAPATPQAPTPPPVPPLAPRVATAAAPLRAAPQPSHTHRISPLARRRAKELGIDPDALVGSGPGGAVSVADVEAVARAAPPPAAVSAPAPSPASAPAPSAVPVMRSVIGAAMARSKREIPHYYLSHTVDLEPALRWLEAANLKRPMAERMLYGVLLLKAVALTLREFPELNGQFVNNQFKASAAIHLGVAISIRQGGLIAPAIHDVDKRNLSDLMAAFRDLVRRARAGSLRSSELSDGTITVTSLGEQGVEGIFPIIYPPQVAIVGFGAIASRPWVVGDAIEPRRVITASLSGDHRVSDGHRGGRFLAALGGLLQEPGKL